MTTLTEDANQAFAAAIKAFCQERRGNSALLARTAGVTPGLITNWKRGDCTPSREVFALLQGTLPNLPSPDFGTSCRRGTSPRKKRGPELDARIRTAVREELRALLPELAEELKKALLSTR